MKKPYYWVDDHPLFYGNNGSLGPIAHNSNENSNSTVIRRDFDDCATPYQQPKYSTVRWLFQTCILDLYIDLYSWLLRLSQRPVDAPWAIFFNLQSFLWGTSRGDSFLKSPCWAFDVSSGFLFSTWLKKNIDVVRILLSVKCENVHDSGLWVLFWTSQKLPLTPKKNVQHASSYKFQHPSHPSTASTKKKKSRNADLRMASF